MESEGNSVPRTFVAEFADMHPFPLFKKNHLHAVGYQLGILRSDGLQTEKGSSLLLRVALHTEISSLKPLAM